MNTNRKCLVTGSNGHLGNNLVRELLLQGETVRASTRNLDYKEPYRGLNCEVVYADMLDIQSMKKAMKGIDTLYHVAAVFSHWSKNPKRDIIEPNINGVSNVLNAAKEENIRKIVLVSSIAAIDQTRELIDENHWSFEFPNPYFESKKLAEEVAWDIAAKHNLDMVTVLPSGMVGPIIYKHLTPTMNFLKMVIENKLMLNPNFCINYVHVQDVAKGMIMAAKKGKNGQRYLLATEKSTSSSRVIEIAQKIKREIRTPRSYSKTTLKTIAGLMELSSMFTGKAPLLLRGNIDHYYNAEHTYDISKAKKELNYNPRDPEEAIREVLLNWA